MSRSLLTTLALLAAAALGGACTSEVDSEGEGEGKNALAGDDDCEVGDARPCEKDGIGGTEHCDATDDGPAWSECFVDTSSGSTPLVLSFDHRAVRYSTEMTGAFDLTGLGVSVATDWPTAETPWLAIDRDGNGSIDGGAELFGSASPMSTGRPATNGFEALAELDSNHDGRIGPEDAAWSRLVVWSDRDGNRASSAAELAPLASSGVVGIRLDWVSAPRCNDRDNCEVERARFDWKSADGRSHTGAVIDVHLATR